MPETARSLLVTGRRAAGGLLSGAMMLVLFVASCGGGDAPALVEVRPFECPAPAASAAPNLFSRGDRLYFSWLVHEGGERHVLQYAVLQGGAWSEARTIAEGDSFFANWADVPSLVELSDGSLAAHWPWRSGSDTYAYDVRIARSADGTSWDRSVRPHRDGTQTEHGFVSLVPDDTGGAILVWLDGRDYAAKEHDRAEMRLMAASLTSAGVSAEKVIDPRTCDCCPTSATRTARGVLVAYRDRSASEVRDIHLLRYENGEWSEPYPLVEDGWQISGCPVNGPALDAAGRRVAAAWFTLAVQTPAVRVAFSADAGLTFPTRVRVDDGHPLGRTDIVLLPNGDALVLWIESPLEGDTEIRARRLHPDGSFEDSFAITTTSAERASGFPRVSLVGHTLYFAWTEAGEPSHVRMATLVLPRSWR